MGIHKQGEIMPNVMVDGWWDTVSISLYFFVPTFCFFFWDPDIRILGDCWGFHHGLGLLAWLGGTPRLSRNTQIESPKASEAWATTTDDRNPWVVNWLVKARWIRSFGNRMATWQPSLRWSQRISSANPQWPCFWQQITKSNYVLGVTEMGGLWGPIWYHIARMMHDFRYFYRFLC